MRYFTYQPLRNRLLSRMKYKNTEQLQSLRNNESAIETAKKVLRNKMVSEPQ